MALIACDECGNEVSDRAASCPKCGNPLSGTPAPKATIGPPSQDERPSQEVSYYSDAQGVSVTNSRIVFVGRTYSLANVSSVGAFTQESKRVEFLLLAGLMAGFGIFGMWQGINACSVFGFSSAVACVVIAALLNDMHFVRITAAGGESNALASKDLVHIRAVVAAINRAIVERG